MTGIRRLEYKLKADLSGVSNISTNYAQDGTATPWTDGMALNSKRCLTEADWIALKTWGILFWNGGMASNSVRHTIYPHSS